MERLVAFEARSRWSLGCQHFLAADTVCVSLGSSRPTCSAWIAEFGARSLFHAGWFERRPGRQVLQPRNPIAQLLVLGLRSSPGRLDRRELICEMGHMVFEAMKPPRQINDEPTQTIGVQRLKGII
ncbi:MAG: hypothetical protein FJX25_12215 [Alphaproteobacteria bacterium]|nr:hypothetical protein [Alphaproteobacteria bacterium]